MTKNSSDRELAVSFSLRRSLRPFIGLSFLLLIVIIFSLAVGIRSNEWGLLKVTPIPLLLYGGIFWYISRYRIWWRDGKLIQHSSDGVVTVINAAEISEIKQEHSDVRTLLERKRPFRRITISAPAKVRPSVIDISQLHFVEEDIRRLLGLLALARPDLEIPRLQ